MPGAMTCLTVVPEVGVKSFKRACVCVCPEVGVKSFKRACVL